LIRLEWPWRKPILRAFVGRDLLESFEAKEMLGYQHSGFSLDAGVCIQAHDHAALQRRLRHCARPPFAMELIERIAALVPSPHIAPARGPPLWQDCVAQGGDGTQIGPDWDLAAQPAPDYEVDRLVNW
jgi:Putative transposase